MDEVIDPKVTIAFIRALPAVDMLRFTRRWCDMQTASDEWSHEEALMQLDHLINGYLNGHELTMADMFARSALTYEGLMPVEPLR